MKKFLIFLCMLFAGAGFSAAQEQEVYDNPETGVSFTYPSSLKINGGVSEEKPLNIIFEYGESPFVVHILFKELTEVGGLEEFIDKERKSEEDGGYRDQMTENKYEVEGGIPAMEFVRSAPVGEIYYFVFPVQESGKLFAFWHMTSKTADPQGNALKAYRVMISSLKIQTKD